MCAVSGVLVMSIPIPIIVENFQVSIIIILCTDCSAVATEGHFPRMGWAGYSMLRNYQKAQITITQAEQFQPNAFGVDLK